MKFICFAAVLISSVAFGQTDYAVTLKNDTVRGDVKFLSYDLMDRIQVGTGKSKKIFTAVQVRNVHQGADTFVPIKWDNTIRMMKVIRAGYMSLYAYRMQNQTRYDGRLLVKMGENPIELPNIGFKKALSNLMQDCPVVSDHIKTGIYDRDQVEKIIEDYNNCMSAGHERRIDNATPKVANATTEFIDELRDRVNASNFTTKTEINDLLNSIAEKVKKGETVPGYMKEGLKGYFSSNADFKEDVDQLMLLLEK